MSEMKSVFSLPEASLLTIIIMQKYVIAGIYHFWLLEISANFADTFI